MADRKKVGVSGSTNVSTGTKTSAGRDNTKEAKFWVSHRGGPFLVHKVGECKPETVDNAGYLDDYDNAIEQGFAPCPKCL